MSTPTTPAAPMNPPPQPAPAAPAPPRRLLTRPLWLGGLVVLAGLAIFIAWSWWSYRLKHSITEDAFVEAHIVNVAPQTVSGHIVRFLVEENDRVEQGQVLAEIDPVPYRDQVNIARSKVDTAKAEHRRQKAALARLKLEVPIQIAIAERTLAAAKADQARAKEALKLTDDQVNRGIEEARAAR